MRGGRWVVGVAAAACLLCGIGATLAFRPPPGPSRPRVHFAAVTRPASPARPAYPRPAWVAVSVAGVWDYPGPMPGFDAPALADPVGVGVWPARLSYAQRLDLNYRLATQMLLGTPVEVLARHGGWARVLVPSQTGSVFRHGVIGWTPAVQLSTVAPARSGQVALVVARTTALRAVAGDRPGPAVTALSYDTRLPVVGRLPHGVIVSLPGGSRGLVGGPGVRLVPAARPYLPLTAAAEIAQARQFLGLPYLWAGTSGFGYDCSGLVYAVFSHFGVNLPRDAADQQRAVRRVPLSALRPGDLLFFAGAGGAGPVHHVGIYLGGGFMLHAPQTGTVVQVVRLSAGAWNAVAGAGRVVPPAGGAG